MRFSIRIGAVLAAIAGTAFAQTVTLEAEDGVLTGTTVLTEVTGFSGSGYVGGWDTDGDSVVLSFNAPESKLYDVKIRYAGPYGSKFTRISYNGVTGGDISLPESTGWETVNAGQALLNAGANTIKLDNNWGWYLIDAIIVSPSIPRGAHQVTEALVNPNANAEAKALMKLLVSKYHKAYLSGQQDPASYSWVETNVGKSPAVLGLDLIEYSPSRVEFGSTSTAIEDAIAFDRRGGIVTFCWHWNSPSGLINTEGHEWWRGFYTEHTTFDVEAALADTTNADYQLLIRDIDAIAVQLKRLQDAGVPVLWRPLHEAEGKWFWWGAKGPEPCKKLWKILYERLTNHHQLNNLIWVWNSVAADWYPGADTVDVLSYDSYPATPGDHGPVSAQYNALLALGGDKKLIAATEVGTIPDADLIQTYQAYWSFFCTWNGEFINNGVHNSLSFLKSLYTNPFVLNLDGIQGWKSASPSSTTTATTTSTTPTTTPTTAPTTAPTTTSTTTTTTPVPTTTSTTPAPTGTAVAQRWGQCGGINHTGPTACVAGTTCTVLNPYYHQCL